MKELLAHVLMVVRRRRPFMMAGIYWCYCAHRDHRTGRRCWQWFVYDSYCAHHNSTCYSGCETEGET